MSRVCTVCGKSPMAGKNIVRKGMAKKKGGIGRKVVRTTKRVFLPNVRKIRTISNNGSIRWAYVCSKCLKKGRIQKPKPRELQKTTS
jgi:large subunit ribosomal protein L28